MFRRAWGTALAVATVVGLSVAPTDGVAPIKVKAKALKKYALLIGCTQYPNNKQLPELYGPANDVPLVAKLLTEQFGFADADVQRLVGWDEKRPETRPTYRNIVAGLAKLLAKADADTQIVVLFSGHGTQVPIPESQKDPLDPKNPEPDGLDEVFLPADVGTWAGDKVPGALLDDEIGAWLDKVRDKGASVWAIFDCCHSGTMTRGVNDVERSRTARPQDVGVPDDAIKEAVARAKVAVAKAGGNVLETGALDLAPRKGAPGSVVAFYGAQAFEEAPELPRPATSPRTREHYYGMLTYTLVQTLRQAQRPMTYRELGQLLVARYRSERGSMSPTPSFEGAPDLDREVLGLRVWSKRSDIILQKNDPKLEVSAGELRGVTPGTILSLHPAAGDARSVKTVLGYVRATQVGPIVAEVEPCEHKGKKALAAALVPDLARCRIVQQDFGEFRVRLAIARDIPAVEAVRLRAALAAMPADTKQLVLEVPDEARADWVFRYRDGKLQLWPGQGRTSGAFEKSAVASALPPRPVAEYAVGPDLGGFLERDLQRVFTLRNLWRVAGKLSGSAAEHGLKLEMLRPEGTKFTSGSVVNPGQRLEMRLANDGLEDLWVTLVVTDADFSISKPITIPLRARTAFPQKLKVTGNVPGAEGIILMAVSMAVSRDEPNFNFLEQPRLGARGRGLKQKLPDTQKATTPFGRLMAGAAVGKGQRGLEVDAPTTPAVVSWSWVKVPVAKKP